MNTFSELPLSPALQVRLTSANLTTPTPVQAAAIPPALAGSDVLATAQTGTGKTLAFLLPVMQKLSQSQARGIQALVLVPTRELAMQVMDTFALLRQPGVESALVVGGLSESQQLAAIRRGARLVVATPGRLEDFLRRKLVRLDGVKTLVLDEADRMLDMGFLPAIRRIVSLLPAERQTLCFSATLEQSTMPFINQTVKNPVRVAIGSTSKPVDRVKLQWFEVATDQKVDLLRGLLDREFGTFLVFARTKHGTERLAKRLTQAGYDAAMIHGDRSQGQRSAALKGFQTGKFRVLVATDIAARGIHVDNIAHVVNYDLPQVAEDFIHRVGRTGRASEHGVASTFATRQESGDIRKLERTLALKMERLPLILAAQTEERGERKIAVEAPARKFSSRRTFAPARRSRKALSFAGR
ncbi:MAG: DEAD/DEAH box helicase [Bryobacteraceae bacterium]